jgi:hypothetical protein
VANPIARSFARKIIMDARIKSGHDAEKNSDARATFILRDAA